MNYPAVQNSEGQFTIDPTHMVALHSLDFGSLYTPDGREHPLTALTPFAPLGQQEKTQVDATSSNAAAQPVSFPWPDMSKIIPEGLGARIAVGIVAILLIVVAAFRITKP